MNQAPRKEEDQSSQHSYESEIRSARINTFRTLAQLAPNLGFGSESKLIDFLKDREVLDLGAGYCGLAIEAYVKNINTRISSISPGSHNPIFELERIEELHAEGYFRRYPYDLVIAAIKFTSEHTYPNFAHHLPFADASFDLVIDSWAISLYASFERAEYYQAALLESLRVLKPGGTFLIGDIKNDETWKLNILHQVCDANETIIQPLFLNSLIQVGFILIKDNRPLISQ